jgi:hypothetical protein
MKIRTPDTLGGYDSRDIGCQMALEPALEEIVGKAEAAGWRAREISKALVYLALARLWGHEARKDIELVVAEAGGGAAGQGTPN